MALKRKNNSWNNSTIIGDNLTTYLPFKALRRDLENLALNFPVNFSARTADIRKD